MLVGGSEVEMHFVGIGNANQGGLQLQRRPCPVLSFGKRPPQFEVRAPGFWSQFYRFSQPRQSFVETFQVAPSPAQLKVRQGHIWLLLEYLLQMWDGVFVAVV